MENFKNTFESKQKLEEFQGKNTTLLESIQVTDGVVCDVYKFTDDSEKDLGIVEVKAGYKTPLQKVLKGDKTIEIFIKGKGILQVVDAAGKTTEYVYPESITKEIIVEVGQLMQWRALDEDLVFAEICYPPYEDGRFENIDEN